MHCTKISAEFEFGDHGPLGLVHTPENVALGYDLGKISAGCLVSNTIRYCIVANVNVL